MSLRFGLLSSVSKARWAATARNAIFRPLLGLREVRDAEFQEHFARLQKQWSARLHSLSAEGWAPLQDPGRFKHLLFCSPFGVQTSGRRWPCHAAHLCPYCFARQMVITPFFNVVWGCYGTLRHYENVGGKRVPHLPREGGRLIEFSTKIVFKRPIRSMEPIISRLRDDRQVEIARVQYQGAFVIQMLEPFPDHVCLHRRGLILCHGDQQRVWDLPPTKRRDHRIESRLVRHHSVISRRVIGEAIARVCRYPAQLFRGDAFDVAAVLTALEKTKVLSHYGLFRNKGIRCASAQQALM
jgi:hypothetical protein